MISSIAIIGAGNMGTALASVFTQKGYEVKAVSSRSRSSARSLAERVNARWFLDPADASREAEVIFITTPDQAIAPTARCIEEQDGFSSGQLVFHTSGAHSSEILKAALESGAYTASLHPLQSVTGHENAADLLEGIFFTVEGHEKAVRWAKKLVNLLSGRILHISPEDKSLYHAGAVSACNYFVTCVSLGLEMLAEAGIDRGDGLSALLPLVKGTVKNLEEVGIPEALTGPIARGDLNTIIDHLDTLEEKLPYQLDLYQALGKYTVCIAEEKGSIEEETRLELNRLFEEGAEK